LFVRDRDTHAAQTEGEKQTDRQTETHTHRLWERNRQTERTTIIVDRRVTGSDKSRKTRSGHTAIRKSTL